MKKRIIKDRKTTSPKTIPIDQHVAEIKRYVGSVSENFQQGLSAVAEQFLGLHEKLDEHGKILNSHTEMIGRLMIDVEEIKVNMREKVSRDEFNKLETRLVSLESFVFSGKGKTGQKTKK